jgi:hypothetical protein
MIHHLNTSGWQIVAHQGLEQFAIDLGDDFGGRVLDLDERILSSPIYRPEIFKVGDWTFVPPYDFNPDLLAEIDVIELDALGRERYDAERLRAIPS